MTLEIKTIDERQRVGIFAVVLGPDGSGKSTVVDRIIGESASYYSDLWQFHWRPGLLPQPGRSEKKNSSGSNPPLPPTGYAYGRVVSFLRYSYFLADFILGYWFRIYPRRRRGQLIIGERWYFDVVVNPQRYGFKLPEWLLRLGGYLIPQPDLTILLTADPDAIYARKPELTVEQITKQIEAMRGILPEHPKGLEVATDIPLDESVARISNELKEADVLRNMDAGWRAFPRYGDAKLLVANADSVALALKLYNPYSRAGRVAKSIATTLPRLFSTKDITLSPWRKDIDVVSSLILRTLGNRSLAISYSTGTPGPHRKMTAQVNDRGRILAYVKIAQSTAAIELLNCEAASLRDRERFSNSKLSTPAVIAETNEGGFHLLFLSAPDVESSARPIEIDHLDILFIELMLVRSVATLSLERLWDINFPAVFKENAVVQDSRRVLDLLIGVTGARVGPTHGDFAPWNTLGLEDGRLFVFDWEYYQSDAPLLCDLFQRMFMPDWLVHRLMPDAAVSHLITMRLDQRIVRLTEKLELAENEYNAYLILFLLRQGLRNGNEQAALPEYIESCLRSAIAYVDSQ